MSQKINLQPPTGFEEYLPEDQIVFNKILNTIKKNYELHGFSQIETPAVERKEVLSSKGGTEKEIYALSRLAAEISGEADTEMALHFDLTVPLARYVSRHERDLTFPFRRYQIQKVWRGESAQIGKGRYREFYQCDIDVIGRESLSLLNDAEIPAIIYKIFTELEIGQFVIKLNNRKICYGYLLSLGVDESFIPLVLHSLDGLEKEGMEKIKLELDQIGLSFENAQKAIAFIQKNITYANFEDDFKALNCDHLIFLEGVSELKHVLKGVFDLGVPNDVLKIDLGVIRGLDYYTGTIYETFLTSHLKHGSICSGGRYENLAQYFTSVKLPGVGISIGLTRLFSIIKEIYESKGIISKRKTLTQVLITSLDSAYFTRYFNIARDLRNAGLLTEVYLEPQKLKNQLSYADKKGFDFAIIAGQNEFDKNLVKIKNLTSKEEVDVEIMNIVEVIKNMIL